MGWGFLFHWLGLGIAEGKIWRLLAVAGIAIACFILAILALSHGFLRISSAKQTTAKSSAPLRFHTQSIERALLKRELKRLLSCPVYMLNCGLGLILLIGAPIYLLISGESIRALPLMFGLSEMQTAFIGAMVISSLASTCYFTAPSVSLEGKTLWILRSAPIDAKKILHSKLYMHLILTAPIILIVSIIVAIFLNCSLTTWVMLLFIPQIVNLLSAAFGLTVGLRFANFDWTNEAIPVKQSLPSFLTMMTMMLLPLLLAVGMIFLDISAKIYLLLSIALITALGTSCLLWLEKKGASRFDRL